MARTGPELLARWDDFSGGHWGAEGGTANRKGSWGGLNVALTRAGTLAPVAASRPFVFSNLADGEVYGLFWAWGVDGKVYFVQDVGGGDSQIRCFTPSFIGGAITIDDVGSPLGFVPVRLPAWTSFSDKVYLSLYGDKTYEINPTGPSYVALTGAPGGRAITSFGERLLVGGLDDAVFLTIGNRIAFTDPGDLNTWPGLNFFDVGQDLTEIAGLYVMLDVLWIIFSDQSMWTFRGVPGSATASQRKAYGFHAGSGGINTFVHTNAVVDPAQARGWWFDHTKRGLARFNGSTVQHVPGFGMLTGERTSELNPDGLLVAHGGPDDVVVDRVPVPRAVGQGAAGESNMLLRVNGAFGLVDQGLIRRYAQVAPPTDPNPPPPEPETFMETFPTEDASFDYLDPYVGDLTWRAEQANTAISSSALASDSFFYGDLSTLTAVGEHAIEVTLDAIDYGDPGSSTTITVVTALDDPDIFDDYWLVFIRGYADTGDFLMSVYVYQGGVQFILASDVVLPDAFVATDVLGVTLAGRGATTTFTVSRNGDPVASFDAGDITGLGGDVDALPEGAYDYIGVGNYDTESLGTRIGTFVDVVTPYA